MYTAKCEGWCVQKTMIWVVKIERRDAKNNHISMYLNQLIFNGIEADIRKKKRNNLRQHHVCVYLCRVCIITLKTKTKNNINLFDKIFLLWYFCERITIDWWWKIRHACHAFTRSHLRLLSKYSNFQNNGKKSRRNENYLTIPPLWNPPTKFLSIEKKWECKRSNTYSSSSCFFFISFFYKLHCIHLLSYCSFICIYVSASTPCFRMHNVMYDICVHIFIVILCCGVFRRVKTRKWGKNIQRAREREREMCKDVWFTIFVNFNTLYTY